MRQQMWWKYSWTEKQRTLMKVLNISGVTWSVLFFSPSYWIFFPTAVLAWVMMAFSEPWHLLLSWDLENHRGIIKYHTRAGGSVDTEELIICSFSQVWNIVGYLVKSHCFTISHVTSRCVIFRPQVPQVPLLWSTCLFLLLVLCLYLFFFTFKWIRNKS